MSRRFRSLVIFFVANSVVAAAVWQGQQTSVSPSGGVLPVLRAQGPRYWKGNLHTHSFWSDGDDFPEMIVDWYRQRGYNFLTLSDHNVLSEGERWIPIPGPRKLAFDKYLARFGPSWVQQRGEPGKPEVRLKPLREFRSLMEEPGKFVLIQGEEITHRFAKNPVHMNGINLRDLVMPIDGSSVAETISVNHRHVSQQRQKTAWPMLVFVNHPNFGWGVRGEDLIQAEEIRFFEVYNGHPGVKNYGDTLHPGCERLWDIALALRLGKLRHSIIYGLATDDAHGYHAYGIGKVNPGRGWIMVRAPYLSAEAIVRAMEAGDFYSTTGVVLNDIRQNGGELRISIQPEKDITYHTEFFATMKDANLDSAPAKDADGKTPNVTRVYSGDIGKQVGKTDSLEPSYRFTGNELYVRARITSSKLHPNPYAKGDRETAWTQPMQP